MPDDRMPAIPAAEMTEEQSKAAEAFASGRGLAVFGPFTPLLRSPGAMLTAMAMGDHFRFHSSLPKRLTELIILITSRFWTQQFEWTYHYPLALEAGLSLETVTALREGRRPETMADDEAAVCDLCVELQHNHGVSDRTYGRVLERFGERGVIDAVGTAGYYSFLGMVMNTARTAWPKDRGPELPLLPL